MAAEDGLKVPRHLQERKPARHPGGFEIRRNSKPLSKTLFTLHKHGVSICI